MRDKSKRDETTKTFMHRMRSWDIHNCLPFMCIPQRVHLALPMESVVSSAPDAKRGKGGLSQIENRTLQLPAASLLADGVIPGYGAIEERIAYYGIELFQFDHEWYRAELTGLDVMRLAIETDVIQAAQYYACLEVWIQAGVPQRMQFITLPVLTATKQHSHIYSDIRLRAVKSLTGANVDYVARSLQFAIERGELGLSLDESTPTTLFGHLLTYPGGNWLARAAYDNHGMVIDPNHEMTRMQQSRLDDYLTAKHIIYRLQVGLSQVDPIERRDGLLTLVSELSRAIEAQASRHGILSYQPRE